MADSSLAASDVGFRVSPTSINSTIAVGDRNSEVVILQNSSSEEIVVRSHVHFAGAQDSVEIVPEPAEVSLQPGGSAQVVIHIGVSDEAQPGQQAATVSFDAASSSTRDVSIVGEVGVAIGVEIIRPVSDVTWSFPRFVDSSERVIFQAKGRNTGNFTTRLEGSADISGMFEGNNSLTAASGPISIGESADLQAVWDETPLFAIKRVTLDLSSGIGAPVEQKAFIIVFPWKLTLMLFLILAVSAAGGLLQPFLAKVFSSNGRRGD